MKPAIGRARFILKTEGPAALFRRTMTFLAQNIFALGTYYLLERSIEYSEFNPEAFRPNVPHLNHRFVTTNEQADILTTEYEDFRTYCPNAWQRLANGAIALCIYIGREPVHINWIATNEAAKRTFEPFPYNVDFANREACIGGFMTMPKYRRKGFFAYGLLLTNRFLKETNMSKIRAGVGTTNTPSLRGFTRFEFRTYGKVRYIKVLVSKFRKEVAVIQVQGYV